jgi:hypothetical protein
MISDIAHSVDDPDVPVPPANMSCHQTNAYACGQQLSNAMHEFWNPYVAT